MTTRPTARFAGALLFALSCGVVSLASAPSVAADDPAFPTRPIRFVLPFPPGSGTDASARFVGQAMTDATHQAVVVDNRTGADGFIAASAVARADPDGYTVFITTMTTQSVNPHIYRQLPYDPVKDFAPVSLFNRSPMVMLVRNAADTPKNFADFAVYAKKHDGPLTYATGNTSSRVAAEFYAHKVGFPVTRVPFRGTPQGLTELLAGRIDFMFVDMSPAVPLVKDGKLRALAILGDRRLDALPDVPTTVELGMPDLQLTTWSAAYVPSGTPKPIVERLSALIQKALSTPDAKAFFAKSGVQAAPSTPDELGAFTRSEYDVWGRAVRFAEIPKEEGASR